MAVVREDEAGDPSVRTVEVTSWCIIRAFLKRKTY
jgi:hypothetical protein